jgi:hypothetical protein
MAPPEEPPAGERTSAAKPDPEQLVDLAKNAPSTKERLLAVEQLAERIGEMGPEYCHLLRGLISDRGIVGARAASLALQIDPSAASLGHLSDTYIAVAQKLNSYSDLTKLGRDYPGELRDILREMGRADRLATRDFIAQRIENLKTEPGFPRQRAECMLALRGAALENVAIHGFELLDPDTTLRMLKEFKVVPKDTFNRVFNDAIDPKTVEWIVDKYNRDFSGSYEARDAAYRQLADEHGIKDIMQQPLTTKNGLNANRDKSSPDSKASTGNDLAVDTSEALIPRGLNNLAKERPTISQTENGLNLSRFAMEKTPTVEQMRETLKKEVERLESRRTVDQPEHERALLEAYKRMMVDFERMPLETQARLAKFMDDVRVRGLDHALAGDAQSAATAVLNKGRATAGFATGAAIIALFALSCYARYRQSQDSGQSKKTVLPNR